MNNISYDIDTQMNTVFRRIRDFLAGRALGITRDSALLHEVVKCLFSTIAINQSDSPYCLLSDEPLDIAKTYRSVFNDLKMALPYVFNSDELLLDPSSLAYVHHQLSLLDLNDPSSDPLGELYQAFIGSDMRMAEGQFFTPQQAVAWLVEAVAPKPGDIIIDPACGTGGFLCYAARYLLKQNSDRQLINDSIFGIEKDAYLSQLASTRIAMVTLRQPKVICGDSIESKTLDGQPISFAIRPGFDIVLTNPPFGAKIKAGSQKARKRFSLACKWKFDKKTNEWMNTGIMAQTTPPQILFLELCLGLLKPGGTIGIVVPESMISNPSTGYVVEYLRKYAEILSVVGMPESLFKTSGKGGTHTKTCLLVAEKKVATTLPGISRPIFMAEAKWCGHDSRGNIIPHNDLPIILEKYRNLNDLNHADHLGYVVGQDAIINNVLAPRYYDPEPTNCLNLLSATHDLVTVQQLVDDGVLSFSTGDELGKLAYGTGYIPFIRTSDISNWEIKIDPKHRVSAELYDQYRSRQDVKEGDILMVRDGTYLIGACAYVSKYDERILYQSHLYKIRVEKPKVLSPFLLLALLASEPVVKQLIAKRFTQDIIDSLGKRVFELILPIPKSKQHRETIIDIVTKCINDRIEARELARKATQSVINFHEPIRQQSVET